MPTPGKNNKDSEGIADGVILKNPGDTIDTSKTSAKYILDSVFDIDYYRDGDLYNNQVGDCWENVWSFYINDRKHGAWQGDRPLQRGGKRILCVKGVSMLKKEEYAVAELEVILFHSEDVILTSPNDEYEAEPMTQAP